MRRTLVLLAVLLVALVAGDQYLRSRVAGEVERAAETAFAASEADADVRGWAVLPQLVTGTIERVDLEVRDGIVGDPPIRVVELDARIEGLAVGLPPPTDLQAVDIAGGTLRLVVHEREVERLVRRQRPGWQVRIGPEGVTAEGQVQGAAVRVTAEAVVEGRSLHLRTREVDAGDLGPAASDAVAAAFDVTLPFEGVPASIRFTEVATRAGSLVVDGVLGAGTLRLGG